MNCKESQQRINDLVWQGQASLIDDALADHLFSCKKCSFFYKQYSNDITLLKSGKRVIIDDRLYDSVINAINKQDVLDLDDKVLRPVIKLAYSAIISVAAILTGIWFGHAYLGGKTKMEKETYSQEIATLNADLNAVNAKIIEYYESENNE